jgi:uncharacterized membrane protein
VKQDGVAQNGKRRERAAVLADIGQWLAPPRFLMFIVLFAGGTWLWRMQGHTLADSFDLGFDGAALVFLASLAPLFHRRCDSAAMRLQAARNDANRVVVLGITTLLTVVIMAAIVGELPRVGHGPAGGGPIALVKLIGTLVLTWLFANMVYALHYAHLYYSADDAIGGEAGGDSRGLDIPGGEDPDYLDFVYFAFTLGMTFQTADVNITGRPIRRIAILHGFAAFVFNIGVIAFTINAIGGAAG